MNAAVDALVCMALITAAIAGVLTVDQSPPTRIDRADTIANTLTTTTTTIEYSPTLEIDDFDSRSVSPKQYRLTRRTHDTLAGLIARATIGGTRTQKAQLTRIDDDFRLRVRNAVRARTGGRVRVDARWVPYPGSPLFAHFSVGPRPLSQSDTVHTATVNIPVGVAPVSIETHDQFRTLGTAVAARLVAVVVPPGPTRVMMRDDEPGITLTRYRYARLQSLTNASLAEPLATENTTEANARLTAALAPEITSDLQRRYKTPAVATEAVSVTTVEIIIRTWGHGGGS